MQLTEKDLNFSFARTKRDLFNDTFPGGAKVTLDNAKKAAHVGLSLRCAAEQLLASRRYERFNMTANRLLATYRKATAETRQRLQSLRYTLENETALLEATAAHNKNKLKHWVTYLDGLAEVFVEAISLDSKHQVV